MESAPLTVHTARERLDKLDALAAQLDRSRDTLVNEAIDRMLELEAGHVKKIREGIEAAGRGEFVSDEEVERMFSKYDDSAPPILSKL